MIIEKKNQECHESIKQNQALQFVVLDLCPKCMLRLSVDNNSSPKENYHKCQAVAIQIKVALVLSNEYTKVISR